MSPIQYGEKSLQANKTLAVNAALDSLLEVLRDPKGIYTDEQKLQAITDIRSFYSTANPTKDDINQILSVFSNLLLSSPKVGDAVKSSTCGMLRLMFKWGQSDQWRIDETQESAILGTFASLISDSGGSESLRRSAANEFVVILAQIPHPLSEQQIESFLPRLLAIPEDLAQAPEVVGDTIYLLNELCETSMNSGNEIRHNLSENQARQIFRASCYGALNFTDSTRICSSASSIISAFFRRSDISYQAQDTKEALDALSKVIWQHPSNSMPLNSIVGIYDGTAIIDSQDATQVLDILGQYNGEFYSLGETLLSILNSKRSYALQADNFQAIIRIVESAIPRLGNDSAGLLNLLVPLSEPRLLSAGDAVRLLTALDAARESAGASQLQENLDCAALVLLALEPWRMDDPKYSSRFGLDAATFGRMVAKASDWPSHVRRDDEPPYYGNRNTSHYADDLLAIVRMERDHPGEKRAKILYDGAGWTYFSTHTPKYYDYLFRFLDGRLDISNKTLFINFQTTRGSSGNFTCSFDGISTLGGPSSEAFGKYGGTPEKDYSDGQIFFLSIQPGSTDELDRIRKWLGENVMDGDRPFLSTRKFPMFMFSMHGSATSMLLEAKKGDEPQGDVNYEKYFVLRDNPEHLKIIGQDWVEPPSVNLPHGYSIGVNNSCSTGVGEDASLAQAMADNLPSVVVAASDVAQPLGHLPFKKTPQGWTLELLETAANYPGLANPKVFYPRTTGLAGGEVQTSSGLSPNYPNPFGEYTQIPFRIHKAGNVSIEIYDRLGQRVATPLENSHRTAGEDMIVFEPGALANGTYFVRMKLDGQYASQTLMIEKIR